MCPTGHNLRQARCTVEQVRVRIWVVALTLIVAGATILACGGMEYGMVNPENDLVPQIKQEIARVWSTVKRIARDLLRPILQLVGRAHRPSPASQATLVGAARQTELALRPLQLRLRLAAA
jgi:hypothetical protein